MSDSEVPFYLAPHTDSQEFWMEGITNPMSGSPSPIGISKTEEKSFWQELAEAPSEAGQYVFDGVSGAWKNVKSLGADALSSVSTVVDAAGNKLGSLASALEGHLILILVVGVAVIYFIAKSGILTQVAALK